MENHWIYIEYLKVLLAWQVMAALCFLVVIWIFQKEIKSLLARFNKTDRKE